MNLYPQNVMVIWAAPKYVKMVGNFGSYAADKLFAWSFEPNVTLSLTFDLIFPHVMVL